MSPGVPISNYTGITEILELKSGNFLTYFSSLQGSITALNKVGADLIQEKDEKLTYR